MTLNIYLDLQGFTTTTTAEGSTKICLRVPTATTSLNYEGTTATMISQTVTMNDDGQDNQENYYTVCSGDATTCYVAIEIDTAVSACIPYLMVPNIVGTYSVADIATTIIWASLTLITH